MRLMTPTQVKALRRRLGLTQSKFADLVGVHVVTVKKWETRKQTVGRLAAHVMAMLAERPRRPGGTRR
jgi:DNA-binding transcriptional regulator YiaG